MGVRMHLGRGLIIGLMVGAMLIGESTSHSHSVATKPSQPVAFHSRLVPLSPPVTTLPPPPVTTLPPVVPVDTVTPAQRLMWSRVAQCEEGGNWHVIGPLYTGGLGISRINWIAYGGLEYAPLAALATPDEQIMVAERIQNFVPDQAGCAPW